jgi:predicted  nucleic acid-binding Zn-ribbon protein
VVGSLTRADAQEHVVKHMATKEDLSELRHELKGDISAVQTQVNSIERQLRETKTEIRLSSLEEKVFGASRA